MTANDPLIKEIKEYTLNFLQHFNNEAPICDDHKNLQSFCICLEKIFAKGLAAAYSGIGLYRTPHAWNWLEKLNCSNFKYSSALDIVLNSKNVFKPDGKLRLLIRACLVKKCLHVPIITLYEEKSHKNIYHFEGSIIGDEILVQILLSVLMQCSKFKFNLDLSNSSFLDVTWDLPKVLNLEVVPCKALGLSVRYSKEKAIIVNIQQNGVAAEDGKIEVGDILDELNGIHISTHNRGNLRKIMKKASGKPVTMKIIKAMLSKTEIYIPIVPLLKHIKMDVQILGQYNKEIVRKTSTSAGYSVTYIGNVSTGSVGDVKKIEFAIRLMLAPFLKPENQMKVKKHQKEVNFEIGEIGVKVIDSENEQEILTHTYMEISSCGSVEGLSHYFAYIAGDDVCNIAKNFTCYIFHSKNFDDVQTILSSIGQGFQRTHYAV